MGNASGGLADPNRFCLCMLSESYVENNDHKWIKCTNCENWYHIHCLLISIEEYDDIVLNKKKWTCPMSQCIPKSPSQNFGLKSIQDNQLHQSNKCSECHFVAKNAKGLKIHSHVHKKTASNSVQMSQTLESASEKGQSNENETVSLNNGENCDLIPCLICNDGKLYKKIGGLKIHCTRRHKNDDYEFMFSQCDAFDTKSFEEKISKLKQNVRILKRIPKGARINAAYKLAEVMNNAANKNDTSSWEELLLFPFKAFKIPENNKKSLTKLVKSNIKNDELLTTFRRKKNNVGSFSKRVESKVADGDVRGAIKILCSSETLAKRDNATYLKLLEKHPSPSGIISPPEVPDDLECLIVDEKMVKNGIHSFPNGSASGIDGLLPQHLKDLIAMNNGEARENLLTATKKICNLMLAGEVNEKIISIIYGANLCALDKDNGDVRPIAVGCTLRRLTSKLACRSEFGRMGNVLRPKQVGVATKGGCEATIHSVRSYVSRNLGTPKVAVKVDLRNAFNSLERDALLKCILNETPKLYRFFYQCYGKATTLFFGDFQIASQVGVQQGDPSGPLLFSMAIHPIIEELTSDLNVWYLDDGTLCGDAKTIKKDLLVIKERFQELALEVNTEKCEIFFLNQRNENEIKEFEEIFAGIKEVDELVLLGSAITLNAGEKLLKKKENELKLLFNRLDSLNKHVAYYLLKHCLGIPKLTYLIRTMPMWKYPEFVGKIEQSMKEVLEKICNIEITEYYHQIVSLPCRFGGLGIRKISDIMYLSFLSSVISTSVLVNTMLSENAPDLTDVVYYSEALNEWNNINSTIPETGKDIQSKWDEINIERIVSSLEFPSDRHMARFKASLRKESSYWLSTLPSKNIDTLLDDNSFRISVALRIGAKICHPHKCRCSDIVDEFGTHGLKCRYSAGRYVRHQKMNNILKRGFTSAKIPATLEPVGLFRDDGKRPDGMTLTTWLKGQCFVWDSTCVDTLAPSYINITKKKAGAAAEIQAKKKRRKYQSIIDQNYQFLAFAVETMGPWSEEATNFANKLGDLLIRETGEARAKLFFMQNISIAIQRGNAASVMGTFPSGANLDEIFYLI